MVLPVCQVSGVLSRALCVGDIFIPRKFHKEFLGLCQVVLETAPPPTLGFLLSRAACERGGVDWQEFTGKQP